MKKFSDYVTEAAYQDFSKVGMDKGQGQIFSSNLTRTLQSVKNGGTNTRDLNRIVYNLLKRPVKILIDKYGMTADDLGELVKVVVHMVSTQAQRQPTGMYNPSLVKQAINRSTNQTTEPDLS